MSNFFDEQKAQSLIKAEIVSKYFWAWAKIVSKNKQRIAYIDLFAGPGRYKDGSATTPIMLLTQVLKNNDLASKLVTYFNDADKSNSDALSAAIAEIPEINKLKYPPMVQNFELNDEFVKGVEQVNLIPTLAFIDPFGYKGLSMRLINSVLRHWACEVVFFFNYSRINMGIMNDSVMKHMQALFGDDEAHKLRETLSDLTPTLRESMIIEHLSKTLMEQGRRYVLPFTFLTKVGNRTSHYLIFVSKHPLGYKIMKEIMAGKSSRTSQGVPSFAYCEAHEKMPLLFELGRPIDELESMLMHYFSGRELPMIKIFQEHHVNRPFIEPNYKQVLINMELKGLIDADPPADRRRKLKGKPTMGHNVMIRFPHV